MPIPKKPASRRSPAAHPELGRKVIPLQLVKKILATRPPKGSAVLVKKFVAPKPAKGDTILHERRATVVGMMPASHHFRYLGIDLGNRRTKVSHVLNPGNRNFFKVSKPFTMKAGVPNKHEKYFTNAGLLTISGEKRKKLVLPVRKTDRRKR